MYIKRSYTGNSIILELEIYKKSSVVYYDDSAVSLND